MNDDISLCRICGFDCAPMFPWGVDGQSPSFELCPRCGVQFGHEDSNPLAIKRYKAEYIKNISSLNAKISNTQKG